MNADQNIAGVDAGRGARGEAVPSPAREVASLGHAADDECGCERLDDGECGCISDREARLLRGRT
jgi:hypothetical protein